MTGNEQARVRVLEIIDLSAGYGVRTVIRDISFNLQQSEIAVLIGPNGSGKSTLLKAIMGLNNIFSGSIMFKGKDITATSPYKKVAQGIIYLPQGNRAFDELTVHENLLMGGYTLPRSVLSDRIESALKMFPALKNFLNRPAYTLSGGELQMLAFARALILRPRLLLLDEPSIGLSPKLVLEVMRKIDSIRSELGCAVLVVEQKVKQVLEIAETVMVMKLGNLVYAGTPAQIRQHADSIFLC